MLKHQSLLSLADWRKNRDWAAEEGSTVLVNGNEKASDLISRRAFGDARIRFEYKIPKDSNSGIYFQDRYEVQIFDSHGKKDRDLKYSDNGGIYERWNKQAEEGEEKGFEGTAPTSNQSKAPNEWQSFDITFKAPTFCLLYTSPSPRDQRGARMPSSA